MRSLFHYQPYVPDHLRGLVDDGRIRFSSPSSFNDPWDCKVRYAAPKPGTPEARRLSKWLLEMDKKWAPSRLAADREVRIASYMMNQAALEQYLLDVGSQMNGAIAEKYRVYCLSETPRSSLMWSHYAGSHTGICLEFDAESYPVRHADAVRYAERYPTYDLATTDEEPLLTKSADWKYEHEWRLVAEERSAPNTWPETIKVDGGFLMLPQGTVKSVTIGCLADAARRAEISAIVSAAAPEIVVRQAHLSVDQYQLVITPDFSG